VSHRNGFQVWFTPVASSSCSSWRIRFLTPTLCWASTSTFCTRISHHVPSVSCSFISACQRLVRCPWIGCWTLMRRKIIVWTPKINYYIVEFVILFYYIILCCKRIVYHYYCFLSKNTLNHHLPWYKIECCVSEQWQNMFDLCVRLVATIIATSVCYRRRSNGVETV